MQQKMTGNVKGESNTETSTLLQQIREEVNLRTFEKEKLEQ